MAQGQNRAVPRSKYENIHYGHTVRKWRGSTGGLPGAGLLAGTEFVWLGIAIDWNFLSDRAQELIGLEIILPGILIGGVCGAIISLIGNQRKVPRMKRIEWCVPCSIPPGGNYAPFDC